MNADAGDTTLIPPRLQMAGGSVAAGVLDVPDAAALLLIAARFAASVQAVAQLQAVADLAAELPDALAYNPGVPVMRIVTALAGAAPDVEQLAGFSEMLGQLHPALLAQLNRNEHIGADGLTGTITSHLAYSSDAQATDQQGRLRKPALPRPAPRPHPYANAEHSAAAGPTTPGAGGIPGEITGHTTGSGRQQQMTDPFQAGESNANAGEPDPPVPEFTAQTARNLSMEELRAHQARLSEIIGFYRRDGTDEDRRQHRLVSAELDARQRARSRAAREAEREQKLLAVPPGAIDRARHLLTVGGFPPEKVEYHIDFYVNRRWTGLFGAEITDEFWAREIRGHKISTGQIPTKKALKSRMSRAARAAGLSRQPSPQVLARKYLTDLEDIEIRLQRAIQRGNEAQWRQDHPAEVVLLEQAEAETQADRL